MDVKQIATLVNNATQEVLGGSVILEEDLKNVVDVGTAVFNANALDKYVKSLVNHIGKVIFVNRAYRGGAPSVLMDGWEYGSVLEKIQMDLPIATENESWELENNTSYDVNVFYQPKVSAKFFNSKVTFEVPISITEMQVKQSFSSATQLNSFISMIFGAVDKSMTIKTDALIMRTINNFIAETIYSEYTDAKYTESSGVRAVNLLKLYNDSMGTQLTKAKALYDKDFLKFASQEISLHIGRLQKISTLFNIEGKERFTPKDDLHVVMLDNFTSSISTYLESDTFHNELVALPKYESTPYWQGTGKAYAFTDVSKIKVVTASNHSVEIDGVIGVLFDRNALGVSNYDKRTTTNYNAKGEFYSNWYKMDAGYFNDFSENLVVFFIQ